jgi:hypothetical protein
VGKAALSDPRVLQNMCVCVVCMCTCVNGHVPCWGAGLHCSGLLQNLCVRMYVFMCMYACKYVNGYVFCLGGRTAVQALYDLATKAAHVCVFVYIYIYTHTHIHSIIHTLTCKHELT